MGGVVWVRLGIPTAKSMPYLPSGPPLKACRNSPCSLWKKAPHGQNACHRVSTSQSPVLPCLTSAVGGKSDARVHLYLFLNKLHRFDFHNPFDLGIHPEVGFGTPAFFGKAHVHNAMDMSLAREGGFPAIGQVRDPRCQSDRPKRDGAGEPVAFSEVQLQR